MEYTDRKDILVGTFNKEHPKDCVSKFHYRVFPDIKPEEPDGEAFEVMNTILTQYPDTTIVTGNSTLLILKNRILNDNSKIN